MPPPFWFPTSFKGVQLSLCTTFNVQRVETYIIIYSLNPWVCLQSGVMSFSAKTKRREPKVFSQLAHAKPSLLFSMSQPVPSLQQSWKWTEVFPKRKLVLQNPPIVSFHDCWREGKLNRPRSIPTMAQTHFPRGTSWAATNPGSAVPPKWLLGKKPTRNRKAQRSTQVAPFSISSRTSPPPKGTLQTGNQKELSLFFSGALCAPTPPLLIYPMVCSSCVQQTLTLPVF